jgi:hypothetical protein
MWTRPQSTGGLATLVPDRIYRHFLCFGYRSGAIKAAMETIMLNRCCLARLPIGILTEIVRGCLKTRSFKPVGMAFGGGSC